MLSFRTMNQTIVGSDDEVQVYVTRLLKLQHVGDLHTTCFGDVMTAAAR